MATRAPRPPSPGGMSVASNVSRVSTISKPTVSASRKQKDLPFASAALGGSPLRKNDGTATLTASVLASIPQGPSAIETMTVEACMEMVSAPHNTWDSASREMARMAAKAKLTEAALASRGGGGGFHCDDTASVKSMSTVSMFSVAKSTTSTVRKGPVKGHMAMLPLGGQGATIGAPREAPDMTISGTAGGFGFITQQRSGTGSSAIAGGVGFGKRVGGYDADNEDTRSVASSKSIVGAAGGRSGIRSARGATNAPSGPNREQNTGANSAPPASRRTASETGSSFQRAPSKTAVKAPHTTMQRKQPPPPQKTDFGDLLKVGGVGKK